MVTRNSTGASTPADSTSIAIPRAGRFDGARRSILRAIAAIPAALLPAGFAAAAPKPTPEPAGNAQEPRSAPAGHIPPGTRCKALLGSWHQALDVEDAPAWFDDLGEPRFLLVTVISGPCDIDGKPDARGGFYFIDSELIRQTGVQRGEVRHSEWAKARHRNASPPPLSSNPTKEIRHAISLSGFS